MESIKIGDRIEYETLIELIEACIENSVQYLSDAKTILKYSPGHAFSLAVFSIEEAGKAIDLLTNILGVMPVIVSKRLKKLFYSHKEKQRIQTISIQGEIMRDKVLEFSKKNKVDLIEASEKVLRNPDSVKAIDELIKKELSFYEEIQSDREKGMYVDIQDGKIITPIIIKEESAKKLIRHAESRLERTKRQFQSLKKTIETLKHDKKVLSEFRKSFSKAASKK